MKLIVDSHLDSFIFKLFLVFLQSLDISKFKFFSKWLLNLGCSQFEGNLPKTFLFCHLYMIILEIMPKTFVHEYARDNKLDVCSILLVIAVVHVNCRCSRKVKTP